MAVALGACGDRAPADRTLDVVAGSTRLVLEVDADDLVHFEFSSSAAPRAAGMSITTTPMVAPVARAGPSRLASDGHGGLATAKLRVSVDRDSLCLTFGDARGGRSTPLTTLCPGGFANDEKSLTLSPETTQNLYGLGEHFFAPNEPNGDLLGREVLPGNEFGNDITDFDQGSTGRAQFPILYATGQGGVSYGLFLDEQYAQRWDFTGAPWRVRLSSDTIRGYFLGGDDLLAVRRAYMDLVGRPPVPPKKMFGLWVSEFGYDDWSELEDKLRTLRANHFPVDGFLLDLQWFGGVFRVPSFIGALTFDESKFPDPPGEIARLRDEQGVGLMLIEEPFIDRSRPDFADLAQRGDLPLACDGCGPVELRGFWGQGSMLDFTGEAAGDHWHDVKRKPLIDAGILGHWTDLGEPEEYSPDARYFGFPELGLHGERDVHNLYNLDWVASIARGYARNQTPARPFLLSRSGTSGMQRFGAAMWSGDIASKITSLATQQNVQMHMSLSGVDYLGSDTGGFERARLDGDEKELYTQWFADGALGDLPLRVHTENLCNCRETAPDRVGDVASNLANLRLRYRLIPYLYSLAHRAYLYGEPVVPPLVVHYPADANARTMSDEKLLGRDLLFAAVSAYGQSARDVYLPAGTWIDFHTQLWIDSAGASLRGVVLQPDGLFRLPLYARAGAIIPEMTVDELTMNALGKRLDGSTRDELVVRVYADERPSSFTLYEDDGVTIAYQRGEVRTTLITQQRSGDSIRIGIEAAAGGYAGAPDARDNVVELVARGVAGDEVVAVRVDGTSVARATTRSDFDAATSGAWFAAGDGLVLVRSGRAAVSERKEVEVDVAGR